MLRLVCSALLFLTACAAPPPAHRANEALQACAAQRGPVTTIVDAVHHLNALPAPVDAACFVASLPRPLDVVATTGITSAQPAASKTSPRIFLLLPGVAVSVVPEGEGAKLLEFGEWVTSSRTLKGELALPPSAPFADDAPFTRVRSTSSPTTCGLCHREESAHAGLSGAYDSLAYRPQPGTEVSARELAVQHEGCVADGDEGPRCQLFHALFDFGDVKQGAFTADVGLFSP